ncbi:MAG: hypothetical protein ACFE96_11765 [Candidatus Hermodarchaeota archaeon]
MEQIIKIYTFSWKVIVLGIISSLIVLFLIVLSKRYWFQMKKTPYIRHELLIAHKCGSIAYGCQIIADRTRSHDEQALDAGFISAVLSYIEEDERKLNLQDLKRERSIRIEIGNREIHIQKRGDFFFATHSNKSHRHKALRLQREISSKCYSYLQGDPLASQGTGCTEETQIKIFQIVIRAWRTIHESWLITLAHAALSIAVGLFLGSIIQFLILGEKAFTQSFFLVSNLVATVLFFLGSQLLVVPSQSFYRRSSLFLTLLGLIGCTITLSLTLSAFPQLFPTFISDERSIHKVVQLGVSLSIEVGLFFRSREKSGHKIAFISIFSWLFTVVSIIFQPTIQDLISVLNILLY